MRAFWVWSYVSPSHFTPCLQVAVMFGSVVVVVVCVCCVFCLVFRVTCDFLGIFFAVSCLDMTATVVSNAAWGENMTGDRDNDVKSVASVLNEIGVGGLNIEVATDNERYLVDMASKALAKSNATAYHWRNISAKGVERAVCIAKEGIYTNWLAFEAKCQCRIALECRICLRTFNVFCDRYRSGTPLEHEGGSWRTETNIFSVRHAWIR